MTEPRLQHPNEVDRKRIERALKSRKRYRYVSPEVQPEEGGYRIQSPCCSRTIDKEGGIIDIARLEVLPGSHLWRLFRKDYAEGHWVMHADYASLGEVLELLKEDPDRRFWQ